MKNADTLNAGITHAHCAVMVSDSGILRRKYRQVDKYRCTVKFRRHAVRYCEASSILSLICLALRYSAEETRFRSLSKK